MWCDVVESVRSVNSLWCNSVRCLLTVSKLLEMVRLLVIRVKLVVTVNLLVAKSN